MERDFYSPFEIVRLDRFSDEMIKIAYNLVIKMNVSLARSAKDNRYFFYREFEYSSGRVKRVSIKRVFDYFLSIEDISRQKHTYVRINQTDYYPFWNMIDTAKSWFTATKYKNLYAKKNGMLVIAAPVIPSISVPGLPMGVTLTAFPTVLETGYEIKQGIQLDIDNGKEINSYQIPIENVFAMYTMFPPYYNLYHEANTMLAMLDIPLGTNRVDMDDKDDTSMTLPTYMEEREHTQSVNGLHNNRFVGKKPTIEDLEES